MTKRHRCLNMAIRGRTPLSAEQIRELAGDPSSADLRSVFADRGNLCPASARAIAESPYLVGLSILSLSGNPIGDEGVAALARSPIANELEKLYLSGCQVTDEGVHAIADAAPPKLATLFLGNNTAVSGPCLTRLSVLPALVQLDVRFTQLDNESAIELARSCPRLGMLTFWYTRVTTDAHWDITRAGRTDGRFLRIFPDRLRDMSY